MAKLTEEQKNYLVTHLACYVPLAQLCEEFETVFSLKMDPRQAWMYDASRPCNQRRMAEDLKALFHKTREAFDKELIRIPIANRVSRLLFYQRAAEKAERDGNIPLALQIYELVEKVTHGIVNRSEVSGPGGKPIETVTHAVVEVPAMAGDMAEWVANFTPRNVAQEVENGSTMGEVAELTGASIPVSR